MKTLPFVAACPISGCATISEGLMFGSSVLIGDALKYGLDESTNEFVKAFCVTVGTLLLMFVIACRYVSG